MANSIKLTFHDTFKEDTFILVRKNISFYRLNDKYYLTDNRNEYLGIFYLVSIRTFNFSDVNTEMSFIHKNTTPEVYKQILEYHNFEPTDDLSYMVFTNQKQFSSE